MAGDVRDSTIVSTRKLTKTDGFVVVDLDDAAQAVGIIRSAPKVLIDGATWLARSATYQFASFGRKVSGASAAINSPVDTKAEAIAAGVGELGAEEWAFLSLDAGRGVSITDLEPLRSNDPRPAEWFSSRDANIVAGIVAAAHRAVGGLSGRSVAIEQFDATAQLLADAFAAAGATIFEAGEDADDAETLHAEVDILTVGSKIGVIGLGNASKVKAKIIVPSGSLPVSAKALFELRRAGTVVLPDFITTAGHFAAWPENGSSTDAATLVGDAILSVLDHPEGPLLGACISAEAFLESWTTIPFGRPIA